MGKKMLVLGGILAVLPFIVRFGEMMHARFIGPRASSFMDAEFFGISVLLLLFIPGIALVIIGGILHTLKI